jgi:hypothetical protein
MLQVLWLYDCRFVFDIASCKATLVANGVLSQSVVDEIEEYVRQIQLARNLRQLAKGKRDESIDKDDVKLLELVKKTENRVLRPFYESVDSLKDGGLVSFSQSFFHRRLVYLLRANDEIYYAIQCANASEASLIQVIDDDGELPAVFQLPVAWKEKLMQNRDAPGLFSLDLSEEYCAM